MSDETVASFYGSDNEMFKPVDSWAARDHHGRQVSLSGKTGIRVVEDGREYFVDSEFSATPGRISVFVDEAFEVSGDNKIRLSAPEMRRICQLAIDGRRRLAKLLTCYRRTMRSPVGTSRVLLTVFAG